MSAVYNSTVQGFYLSYYGRPADPAGLTFWTGQLAAAGEIYLQSWMLLELARRPLVVTVRAQTPPRLRQSINRLLAEQQIRLV